MEITAKLGPDGKPIAGTFEIKVPQTIQEGQLLKSLQGIAMQRKQLDEQEAKLLEIKNEIDKLQAEGT